MIKIVYLNVLHRDEEVAEMKQKFKTVYLEAWNWLSWVFVSRSTLCSVMAQLTEDIQPSFETTVKSKAVSENCNVKFSCVVSGRTPLNFFFNLHAFLE